MRTMADIREQIAELRHKQGYGGNARVANTLESLLAQNELLLSAHVAISKGVGAYSQDQLTNAGNTIDSIVKIADKAIADCND